MKEKMNSLVTSIKKKSKDSLMITNILLLCHSIKNLLKEYLVNPSQLSSYYMLKMKEDNLLQMPSKLPPQVLKDKSYYLKPLLMMDLVKDLLIILVSKSLIYLLYVLLILLVMISENSLLMVKLLAIISLDSLKNSTVVT